MDEDNVDEFIFQSDDAEKAINDVIESLLVGQAYIEAQVPHWINTICEKSIEALVNQAKPYKYMLNCMIMQRTGAAVSSVSSCYWDGVIDGCVTIKWPREKESKEELAKNQMNCIVTLYASSLNPNR